jgi:hypothetical protein
MIVLEAYLGALLAQATVSVGRWAWLQRTVSTPLAAAATPGYADL